VELGEAALDLLERHVLGARQVGAVEGRLLARIDGHDGAHLPGAKHMALEEIEGRLAELHMLAGQPVLYCRGGDKTKELAARLAEQGMPVAFLDGGLLAWESDGLPIERG
ncbi:MAG: rhodanese-like domain-containing protein, partial [Myxococcales bacterium]